MGNNSTKLAKEVTKVAVPRTNVGNQIAANPEIQVTRNANSVQTPNLSADLNTDILKEISKWQATKKPISHPPQVRTFESVHVIRMKKENELKSLTELGSPPGLLTEEKLHEFFKEFRDNPNQDVSIVAKKFHLDEIFACQIVKRSRLPVITKDFEEGELSIAHVWDR